MIYVDVYRDLENIINEQMVALKSLNIQPARLVVSHDVIKALRHVLEEKSGGSIAYPPENFGGCRIEVVRGHEIVQVLPENKEYLSNRHEIDKMFKKVMEPFLAARWIDEKEHDRLVEEYKRRIPEDEDELTEEDIKDIAEAMADIKAGRVHTAEKVYEELGLTGKKRRK